MVSSSLHLLKSNAVLVPPTEEKPYHQILVKIEETGCSVSIAATKPLTVPIHIHPLHADFKKHKPKHLTLRHKRDDNASYAFYPDFEYETGEALAHASLTASLALGKPIPECYEYLIKNFSTPKARGALRQARLDRGEFVDESDSDSDDNSYSDDSDDSDISSVD